MPDLGILGLKFENTVVINKFSAFQFVKFWASRKMSKFGTKNVLFRCFEQQFWKPMVIFEISALEIAL